MNGSRPTRRDAIGGAGAVLTASVAAASAAQGGSSGQPVRLVPRADLVNVLEYEEQAKLKLGPAAFAGIAGSDRSAFDRITLRPRVMIPTRNLDLGLTLFGQAHAAPIIVGPVVGQEAFDPGGLATTLQGAAAASAAVVAAGAANLAFASMVSRATSPVWFQLFAGEATAGDTAKAAVAAGCRAVLVTVGAAPAPRGVRASGIGAREWRAVGAAAGTAGVPVLVKGITSPDMVRLAIEHGASGVVFSNYGGLLGPGGALSILDLPAVVAAASGRVPVLVDGSFRRGSDVLKALALGAAAVLVARPVMWGLSAYGADGVRGVLEMLQTELARSMAMCGKTGLKAVDASVVRVHTAPKP